MTKCAPMQATETTIDRLTDQGRRRGEYDIKNGTAASPCRHAMTLTLPVAFEMQMLIRVSRSTTNLLQIQYSERSRLSPIRKRLNTGIVLRCHTPDCESIGRLCPIPEGKK